VAKIEQDREEHRHVKRETERAERETQRIEREKQRTDLETQRLEREHRRLERKKTFRMSEKTVQDTIGVKIMTIVALIYLPSTFVAVGLNSYLHVAST